MNSLGIQDRQKILKEMFADGIRKILRKKRFSQKYLAYACELSQPYISRILDCQTNPTMSTMQKIAESLDCTVLEILEIGKNFKRPTGEG